jgi:hypothetical protein
LVLGKLPLLEEIRDLETNHPGKMFRKIEDVFLDLEAKRGYHTVTKNKPKLTQTAIEDVADFEGNLVAIKEFKTFHKGRIIAGIIIAIIGGIGLGYGMIDPRMFPYPVSSYVLVGSIIFIIIGVIIALVKAKIVLISEVLVEGESYKYKGEKSNEGMESEKRERLDLVSDVRIIVRGKPSPSYYYEPKYKTILNSDLDFLVQKINKIVSEYRIPSKKE